MQTSTNPSSRFGWIPPWLRRLFNADGWAYGLFWSWNAVFLAFMILGFAPQLLPVLLAGCRRARSLRVPGLRHRVDADACAGRGDRLRVVAQVAKAALCPGLRREGDR
ncbi:MAG: hypothetical protein R2873_34455 [Caldilineaceae bacterium]